MRDYVDRRVTHQSVLPHLLGVPHLHVNRPLKYQRLQGAGEPVGIIRGDSASRSNPLALLTGLEVNFLAHLQGFASKNFFH